MKIIVGLGNPGSQYQDTLHNAGFMAVDHLSDKIGQGTWGQKFKGVIMKGQWQGKGFLLLKPQTYMNLSGESVQACLSFYKADIEDVLVIADDLDLPIGKLRFRTSGGHGGHNGLRNIIQLCGSNRFQRIKIGIGRPKGSSSVSNHVLGKAPKAERDLFETSVSDSVQYQLDFICGRTIQIAP